MRHVLLATALVVASLGACSVAESADSALCMPPKASVAQIARGASSYGGLTLTPARTLDLAAQRNPIDSATFEWVPETHRLLYSTFDDAEGKSWVCSLDVDTGATLRLIEGEQPTPSPDGTRI